MEYVRLFYRRKGRGVFPNSWPCQQFSVNLARVGHDKALVDEAALFLRFRRPENEGFGVTGLSEFGFTLSEIYAYLNMWSRRS
jgi:hypothetical protein